MSWHEYEHRIPELEAIREYADGVRVGVPMSLDDVLKVIDAVDSTLELHDGAADADGRLVCPECTDQDGVVTVYWPCGTVADIRKALKGEQR